MKNMKTIYLNLKININDFDEYGNDYKNEKKVIDISPISRKNISSSTSTSAYDSSNSDTNSDIIFMFTKRPRQNN